MRSGACEAAVHQKETDASAQRGQRRQNKETETESTATAAAPPPPPPQPATPGAAAAAAAAAAAEGCYKELDKGPGVLILSEFAGAAEFLQEGSIIINPWNEHQSAEALFAALTMQRKEREERHKYYFFLISFFFSCFL